MSDFMHNLAKMTLSATFRVCTTLDAVEAWEWEVSSDHVAPVPKMPREERTSWVALEDKDAATQLGGARLAADETALLRALRRKMRFRADRERS